MSNPSAIDAISPAIDHTDETLFKPFDLGRWFILGFLTFLEALAGGCSANANYSPGDGSEEMVKFSKEAFQWITNHLTASAVVGGGVALLAIALFLLFQWLSARGGFAYLDCIVNRKAEVSRPWKENETEADSFFVFRLIVNLLFILLVFIEIAPIAVSAWAMSQSGTFSASGLFFATSSIACIAVFIVTIIFFVLFTTIMRDFVMPIQFMKRISCIAAVKIVWQLIRSNPAVFLIYWVMKMVIGTVIGIIIFIAGCITCCIAFCCVAIPVIGQTILQPVFVFNRSYPLFLLQQFGPDFDPFGQNVHEGEVLVEPADTGGPTISGVNGFQSPTIDTDPLSSE